MDYDTLRLIPFVAFGPAVFVISLFVRRGRKYWPAVALTVAVFGYVSFLCFSAGPSPERAWWGVTGLAVGALICGVCTGIGQRRYLEHREKK